MKGWYGKVLICEGVVWEGFLSVNGWYGKVYICEGVVWEGLYL